MASRNARAGRPHARQVSAGQCKPAQVSARVGMHAHERAAAHGSASARVQDAQQASTWQGVAAHAWACMRTRMHGSPAHGREHEDARRASVWQRRGAQACEHASARVQSARQDGHASARTAGQRVVQRVAAQASAGKRTRGHACEREGSGARRRKHKSAGRTAGQRVGGCGGACMGMHAHEDAWQSSTRQRMRRHACVGMHALPHATARMAGQSVAARGSVRIRTSATE